MRQNSRPQPISCPQASRVISPRAEWWMRSAYSSEKHRRRLAQAVAAIVAAIILSLVAAIKKRRRFLRHLGRLLRENAVKRLMQGTFRILGSRLKASTYVSVRSDQHGPSFPDSIDGFELFTNKIEPCFARETREGVPATPPPLRPTTQDQAPFEKIENGPSALVAVNPDMRSATARTS